MIEMSRSDNLNVTVGSVTLGAVNTTSFPVFVSTADNTEFQEDTAAR